MKKLLLILPLLLVGCVSNRLYRAGTKSTVTVQPPVGGKPSAMLDGCEPKPLTPCMAFLEFDDFGEMFEAKQLDHAIELIESSKTANKHPVVVTFVHGWQNNADPGRDKDKEGNAYGFGQALIPLAEKYKNTPVIGIYVAWRGELVSKYWPLRRQFSYFNREQAAIRIPGARMTNALARIVRAAHDVDGYAIQVGHSFGGLILERALTQATVNQIQSVESEPASGAPNSLAPRTPAAEPNSQEKTRADADLTVFVNSAAPATEAKQMLDVLKDCKPQPTGPPRNPDTALFISISSMSDAATKVALPIGHGYPFLKYKFNGSLRANDPLACSDDHISQGSFYMSSAAHMAVLQSHQVVEDDDMSHCKQAAEDRRSNDVERASAAWQYFTPPFLEKCYKIEEKKDAWNNTPYWIMEVPSEIIPDHSTIFTGRLISMLVNLVPPNAQVEASPPAAKFRTKATK